MESLPGVDEESLEGQDLVPCHKCYLHPVEHEALEHGYRAEVDVGEHVWLENALTFASEGDATAYVDDLMTRWLDVRDTRVVPAATPLNEVIDR